MPLDPTAAGRIDALFADMGRTQHPGAALLIVEGSQRLATRCFGLADFEAGRPIAPDSAFYLASISKQFTAMGILQLAERGTLRLDDRLHDYFPQFPAWGARITLRHLLHQTSGIPDYFALFLPDKAAAPNVVAADITRHMNGLTNETVLDRVIRVPRPDFPPGSQHAYSNTNYTLLSMIVAFASGQPFAVFMRDSIFAPLGMGNTLVYALPRPPLRNLAHGYVEENGSFRRWNYPLLTTGDGGMFSTLDDLFLWDQALNTEKLLPRAALERFLGDGTTDDGADTGYGFGWMTNVFGDARHAAHGGSLGPYNNCLVRYLDRQRSIVLLTNHYGVPGPRIRVQQVAEIAFDR